MFCTKTPNAEETGVGCHQDNEDSDVSNTVQETKSMVA